MPKKHQKKSLLTKPTSGAPSTLSLSYGATGRSDAPAERTVNELIKESRRPKGNEPSSHAYQSPRSIPPTLRAVLNLPAPSSLPTRNAIQGPARFRRIPGPPPPRSWLVDSRHAPEHSDSAEALSRALRQRVIKQSSNLPNADFPPVRSLRHALLKAMASHWAWHAEYDHFYLTELPVKTRETLLSYIAVYSEGHGLNPLRVLFPSGNVDESLSEVTRLDLSNALGDWANIRMIERDLLVPSRPSPLAQSKQTALQSLPDAWDAEEDDLEHPSSVSIPPRLSVKAFRFRNLQHLSLATSPLSPTKAVSWQDLLGLAGKLPPIRSLSLAYWPQPTYTPNAAGGRFKVSTSNSGSSPSVLYGGSNFFTAFDNDWREAAGILRSLSRILYCLEWLDLTGCGEWFPALTWSPMISEDEPGSATLGPDWTGAWRGLEHLILDVGWTPGPEPAPDDFSHDVHKAISPGMEAGGRTAELLTNLSRLRLNNAAPTPQPSDHWDVEYERAKYHHRKETERHKAFLDMSATIAETLRRMRREHGGKWLEIQVG